jgi:hypothetical protein
MLPGGRENAEIVHVDVVVMIGVAGEDEEVEAVVGGLCTLGRADARGLKRCTIGAVGIVPPV